MSEKSRTSSAEVFPARASVWSSDKVAVLKALWADGDLSASLIAQRLGVSRNAVLGKIHRLGLSSPRAAAGCAQPQAPRAPRLPRVKRRATVVSAWLPSEPLPTTPGLPSAGLETRLERLSPQACHWPIGDPAAPDFAFCGRPAGGRIYCPAHWALAHRPRRVRRSR